MGNRWKPLLAVLTGTVLAVVSASADTNTISARPGAVNYIEGAVSVNDKPVSAKELRTVFLSTNDTLTTSADGRAEVLLTPGVFLRVGQDSEVRLVSPSLIDTQVELINGEAMVEASGLVKDNNLQIIDHGTITTIKKNGLYHFSAGNPPRVSVFDGKAQVELGDKKVDLKKGRQAILADGSKAEKFDRKKTDELYAWSNVRSAYEAQSSYHAAQLASAAYGGDAGLGSGFGPGYSPGWFWNSAFNSYAWLPGSGAFFSPFGYGFYSPGIVGYAPVVYARPGWNGGRGNGNRPGNGWQGRPNPGNGAPIPVRPGAGNWHGSPGAGAGNWHGNPGAGASGWHGGGPGGGGWRGGGGAGASSPGSRPSMGGGGGGGMRGGGGSGASRGGGGGGGMRGK